MKRNSRFISIFKGCANAHPFSLLPCSSLYCINIIVLMNPCPCGNYPDKKLCRCSQKEIKNYQSRISRPILDRIDICVQVSNPKFDELQECEKNESSAEIKKRVNLSREIQRKRYENEKIKYNSELTPVLLNKYCRLGKEETGIVKDAFQKLGLSARSYHRLLKVARTIADLAGDEKIKAEYLCEAISYRNRISFD